MLACLDFDSCAAREASAVEQGIALAVCVDYYITVALEGEAFFEIDSWVYVRESPERRVLSSEFLAARVEEDRVVKFKVSGKPDPA